MKGIRQKRRKIPGNKEDLKQEKIEEKFPVVVGYKTIPVGGKTNRKRENQGKKKPSKKTAEKKGSWDGSLPTRGSPDFIKNFPEKKGLSGEKSVKS